MIVLVEQPKCTWDELVNNLKAVGTAVTRNSIGNTLHHYGLESFRSLKVPLAL